MKLANHLNDFFFQTQHVYFSFSGCLASSLFWPQAIEHVEDRD